MSAPINGMNCISCLYFERTDERFGECRRHAPHPNAAFYVPKMESVGKINTDIHWPRVFNNSWCGQFAVRKKSQKTQSSTPGKIVIQPPKRPAKGEEVLKLRPEEPEPANKNLMPSITE